LGGVCVVRCGGAAVLAASKGGHRCHHDRLHFERAGAASGARLEAAASYSVRRLELTHLSRLRSCASAWRRAGMEQASNASTGPLF
jgi:hypothetical protein